MLVVGSGLAGVSAALRLAEAGHEVGLVSQGPGATALVGGTLDAASPSPGVAALPWRDPLRGHPLSPRERLAWLVREAPAHPHAAVFREAERAAEAVTAGFGLLAAALAEVGLPLAGSLDETLLLATSAGTLRPSDWALASVARGDVRSCPEIQVAAAPGLEGHDPAFLARTLADELDTLGLGPRPVRVVQPRWPESLIAGAPVGRAAAALDGEGGEAMLDDALKGQGGPDVLLLLPPILGVARNEALWRAAERTVGGPVAELVGFAPHTVAGFRIDLALQAALERAGVEVERGHVCSLQVGPAGPRVGVGDAPPRQVDGVVLATGRFTAGGLVAGAGDVREPLLDLPLYDDDDRRLDGVPARRAVRKGYGNRQPLYAAGARTDRGLHPLDARGRAAWPGVVLAGDLVGGFDPARERTGAGWAVASGFAAAEVLLGLRGEAS
jgi:glycerol-3-phosphate dehydrogenase subunit B